MKFKFDPNQEYQLNAIQAVTDLFKGQLRTEFNISILGGGPQAVANKLELGEEQLLDNLEKVQAANGLPQDKRLEYLKYTIQTSEGNDEGQFPNFTIEMETGTGKTYVYLRTILELYQLYGMRKFIIVVPSIAIREGIIKTLQITEEHFRNLYNNPSYRYFEYDSSNLGEIRQFALSGQVEIMIMTLASFNKDINVIYQTTDRFQGETPIHMVQTTRPVVILDEPQNMESELSRKSISTLNPLFALRYSATHRTVYNMVYRLTPYQAYQEGLVKRIEVAGVEETDSDNAPFIQVDKIITQKNTVTAKLTVHRLLKSGQIKEIPITVRPDDNLEVKTNRSDYDQFKIEEINPAGNYIRFTNGREIAVGESIGANKEAIWEAQIQYTIEEHFRKQARLKAEGIKILSLFFIDRVDNYIHPNSIIRKAFNQAFMNIVPKYKDTAKDIWGQNEIDPEMVQGAYFANRRNRAGDIIWEDSITGEAQKDKVVYDLIMKDKERLLSFEEPIAFIFSHSALREGWDNPNVFQICTLNQSASDVKKRQEIGRGVRLAVNQEGDRNREEHINILTVVTNESYQNYVAQLQTEFEEVYGPQEQKPPTTNARERGFSKLQKAQVLSDNFKGLWEKIKHKTRYFVKIDSEKLIREVVAELDYSEIETPRVTIIKAQVQIGKEESLQALQLSGAKTIVDLAGRFPLPNLVTLMEEFLERTTPPMKLSRHTLLEIYKRTTRQQAGLDNPQEFANVVTNIVRRKLMNQLIQGIQYEKINEWYEMSLFEEEISSWRRYLQPADKSLYNPVELDIYSTESPEYKMLQTLEARKDIKLYIKLPKWFTVDTPLGEYNPDWAIVIEPTDEHGQATGKERIYLVHETKSTRNSDDLRPDEHRKIICGERHFRDALGVEFDWGPNLNQ